MPWQSTQYAASEIHSTIREHLSLQASEGMGRAISAFCQSAGERKGSEDGGAAKQR